MTVDSRMLQDPMAATADDATLRAASDRVFSIPELVECILLNMTTEDLLVNAQRVNKTCHSTIQDSRILRQALFFEEIPRDAIRLAVCTRDGESSSKGTPPQRYKRTYNFRQNAKCLDLHGMILNPSFPLVPGPFLDGLGEQTLRALGRPDASWRLMLPTQPAIRFSAETKCAFSLGDFEDWRAASDWMECLQECSLKEKELRTKSLASYIRSILR